MDNLCHSLVGAALAGCGLRRRTRYATAALVLGANFPDIDVLALFGDNGLGFRRGITHGIPALIVWPFVLTGILLAWDRFGPGMARPLPDPAHGSRLTAHPSELLKLSALAIFTHPTLDWMNTYGMRWLMPFNGAWTSADALFIVDPWLYLMLGAAWIVGSSQRHIVSSSHRPIVSSYLRTERFARGMVALASIYILAMMALSAYGRGVAARQLGLEHPSRRELMISPVFLDSWRRQVTAEVGGVYRFGELSWRNREVHLHPSVMASELELIVGRPHTPQLNHLLDWARFPFARVEGEVIRVDDARYTRGGTSFAGVTIPR